MKVSVTIVNTNNREVTLSCLESIYKNTTGIEFEVVLVDNNSTDGSTEAVKNKFPQVRLIESKQKNGFTVNHNMAIKQAKGEHVFILNDDTVLKNNVLKILSDFLNTHPDAGAVTCKLLNPDGTYQITSIRGEQDLLSFTYIKTGLATIFSRSKTWGRPFMAHLDREKVQDIKVYSGAAAMIRREVLEKTGLMDEQMFLGPDDWDMSYRIRKAGWKIYYIPEARILHCGGSTVNKNMPFRVVELHKSIFRFYLKHYGRYLTLYIRLIVIISALAHIALNLLKYLLQIKKAESRIVVKTYFEVFKVSIAYPINLPKIT